MRPHTGVAVGLQLGSHPVAGRALSPLLRAPERALQVLHVMSELVGDDVLLRERASAGTELSLQHLEEVGVEVGGLVYRAIERPDVARGGPTAGVGLAAEQLHPRAGIS